MFVDEVGFIDESTFERILDYWDSCGRRCLLLFALVSNPKDTAPPPMTRRHPDVLVSNHQDTRRPDDVLVTNPMTQRHPDDAFVTNSNIRCHPGDALVSNS